MNHPLRVAVRTTDLASAPSPAELEAITIALQKTLGRSPGDDDGARLSQQRAWRFAGRWWSHQPGAAHRAW